MRKVAVAVLSTFIMAGSAWCDDLEDTFNKVDKHLYGIERDTTQPPPKQQPRRKESPPPVEDQQIAEPAPPPQPANDAVTWDFETGDLRGWTATGKAFNNQPTYGDNPTARHRGQPSEHQGDFWIGGFENRPTHRHMAGKTQGDGPQGTLTSATFIVSMNTIGFLVGGGCDLEKERVELLIDGKVVDRVTGKCTETLARDSFPVGKYRGRTAQIRLVDESSGGWGHINFDDLRFE